MTRKAFNFYQSHWEQIKLLNDKQKLELFNAICSVQFLEINIDDVTFKDNISTLVWTGIKHSLGTSLSGFINKNKSLNKDVDIPLAKGGKEIPTQDPCLQLKGEVQEEEKGKVEKKEEEPIINLSNLSNTKKDFKLFIEELYKNSLIKSKVTKGQGNTGYESYIKISDKRKLHDDYIKHQSEEKKYAKTITNYMIDYEVISSGLLDAPANKQPTQQIQNTKTIDEVLNIYIAERKKNTNKDYTLGKCKEMLHWNFHKDFEKVSTRFEQEMMEQYGYDWINGRVNFDNELNEMQIVG